MIDKDDLISLLKLSVNIKLYVKGDRLNVQLTFEDEIITSDFIFVSDLIQDC